MKSEIEIPPQYLELIKAEAEKHSVSFDEIVESVIREFLERSRTDAE